MPVTLRDIAKEVNVSHTTVSLVLNNRAHASISAATRARVIEAATRLGYRPNHLARALVTGRTHTAAVWTFTPSRPYYAAIIRSLQVEADRLGYRTLISQTPSALFTEEAMETSTIEWPVDGVIAMDSHKRVEAYLGSPDVSRVPVVSMGTFVSEVVDHVAIDIGPGIVDAVNHLWAQGRRRIAYLTLAAMSDVDVAGSGSYTNAITALGGADERILLPLHGRSVARTGIVEYFRTNGQPDAIIARSDEYAIGAFRGLRDLGLSVPGDVAIVGCGGIDDVRYLDPELSTVTVPIDEMSKLAWRFLKQRIKHPTSPLQSAKLYATLDVRGSSA